VRDLRVAFVVQRCGNEVVGGAESLCLQIASHLRGVVDVEILTTCAVDYRTWRNEYPAGRTQVDGVNVRRFPVDAPRDVAAFDRLSREIAAAPERASAEGQERWMRAQGPLSTALLDYVRDYEGLYDVFVFCGYLYATTALALPRVAHKAVLLPFAHDEWPIRLPMWDEIFASAQAIVSTTKQESDFVRHRFPALNVRRATVAASMEPPADRNPERFRARYGIQEPFLLYLGRVDPSKGVDELFDHFRRYRAAHRAPLKLVVAGSLHARVPADPNIVVAGRIDEGTKWDALAACELLVMPSEFESLSLVLLEAWACAKPVLVNAKSAVLVGQCRRSGGGVWYANYAEFGAALDLLDAGKRRQLGRQGQEHFRIAYNWDEAVDTLVELLSTVSDPAKRRPIFV
jgi:glycosyltransferase involved in cell wall biosynthesis